MSLFSRFKKLFLREKTFSPASSFGLIKSLTGSSWSDLDFLRSYGKSLYVYACVSRIATKVASIDFNLNRIINKEGDTEEVLIHPALDLLYKVNPFYTKAEFLQTDVINRKLTGDSFILKVRNNAGEVVELWNIRPDLVTIYPDKEKYISHYEVMRGDGTRERIEPSDMIHIKYPSPLETFFGMSPLSAAKHRIDTEEYASRYQRDFFLNNGRPDAILKFKDNLTESQIQELRESWEERHRGVGKSSKIAVLWGDAEYNQVSLSQKEMDFIESMKFTRDDILVAFGVPKPIVAVTEDVNYANSKTAQEIFLSETIIPEVKMLVDKLNEELIAPEYGEEYFLTFDDPVPINREMRLAENTAGVDRWITRNEARQDMGLEALEGGDSLWAPLSVLPVASAGGKTGRTEEELAISQTILKPIATAKRQKTKKNYRNLYGKIKLRTKFQIKDQIQKGIDEIKEEIKKKVNQGIEKEIQEASMFKDKEKRKQYWEYINKSIDKKSKRMRSLVVSLTNKQKEEFINKFRNANPKTKKEIRELFDRKEQNKIFKKAILPLMFSIFKEAGEDTMDLLRFDRPFNIEKAKVGPTILALLEKRAMFFANSVNETTLLGLTETLAEGIEAGEGISELEKRILEEYDHFSNYRAERIARTETTAVVNEAHLEAYEQSEVVEGKEWIATLDDRVRDEHLMMDGEIVKLHEKFSNGLDFPNEPNCRCTIAPIPHMV